MEKMEDYYKEPKKKIDWRYWSREILEVIVCFLIAYVIFLIINFFFGSISGVKQVSMFPTIKEGDSVLIQRATIFKKTLKRGDIITFEAPIDKGYYKEVADNEVVAEYNKYNFFSGFLYKFVGIGKVTYVKRVIGVAGDHVVINEDGTVSINDEVIEEPYLNEQRTAQNGQYIDVIVPENCIYVMGDNRQESKDSRFFGCIPLDHVDGYVKCRVWPLNKIGGLQ
ncbi:signal peptidase I [Clostridium sp. CAG:921]|mgnify:FL=1|nr:signal peptidase I [Clostridium sp. CAG:921]